MLQVKIFKDGKEKQCVDCDLLVLACFKNAGDSTDLISCIAGGSGVIKHAVTDGLAKVVARTIHDITEDDILEELLLTSDFLNIFAKCISSENQEPETAEEGE